jgi:hypothetical protein
VTVLGAMLLALVCVGWLLFFIHHISSANLWKVDFIGAHLQGAHP